MVAENLWALYASDIRTGTAGRLQCALETPTRCAMRCRVPSSSSQPAADVSIEHSIVAARNGLHSGLGQLLDHYRDYLLRIAHDEMTADLACRIAPSDLVQDTFLEAARDFPRFTGKTDAELRVWLRRVLLNNLRAAARRWQRTCERVAGTELPLNGTDSHATFQVELSCPQSSPSTLLRTDEERQRVRLALQQLPRDYRPVIELRTLEEKSFAEVAAAMERSADAVRKLWSRAVERLAKELSR